MAGASGFEPLHLRIEILGGTRAGQPKGAGPRRRDVPAVPDARMRGSWLRCAPSASRVARYLSAVGLAYWGADSLTPGIPSNIPACRRHPQHAF